MKLWPAIFLYSILAGASMSAASAQLVRLSFTLEPDPVILFRAGHATTPWDRAAGFVTDLDLQYDLQATPGMLAPERNFWHAHIESSELGNFDLVRPIHDIYVMGNYVEFSYRNRMGPFETFSLSLVFHEDVSLHGEMPRPPFPGLDTEGLLRSGFSIDGGRSYFDVPDLAEGYGGGRIQSVEMTPIPEFVDLRAGPSRGAEHRAAEAAPRSSSYLR
jgi:hypothetical protein